MEALGATLARALLDDLPRFVTVDPSSRATRDPAVDGRARAREAIDRYDLDPERVWLIEAPDSVTAARVERELAADPAIEWVEPNAVREALDDPGLPAGSPGDRHAAHEALDGRGLPPGFPNDPLFLDGRQWGLENRGAHGVYGGVEGADIGARQAWSRSCGSASLRLALADTGIDPHQPELQAALPAGLRIERGINVTEDPSGSWADSVGHGTAVAGVMAARTGEGTHFDSLGVAGVCGGDGGANPGCRIVAIKITPDHSRYATSFDIARAILYALAAGARAINLSFAGSGPSRLERQALHYAIVRGCLVVAASGNRGASAPRAPQYPAAYAADGLCLQVGASDPWDRRAAFSSYGPGLDVLAPGVDVWTTSMTYPSNAGASYPGCVAVSGTSLAAPFATGVAGLLAAARPELAAEDVRAVVRATARDMGSAGVDEETGAGALDAAAALRAVAPDIGIWHDEVAADAWIEAEADSLVVGEGGFGSLAGPRTWPRARRIEVRATVAIPDSFVDSVRVWARVAGTTTVRGDFRLPYFSPLAEVAALAPRSFTLRGSSYRAVDDSGAWLDLPLPLDQARFGFTVAGRVRGSLVGRPEGRATLGPRASPNPFGSSVRFERPAGASLALIDVAGRRVREWPADGSVAVIVWDGLDAAGRRSPPGLYWLRSQGPRGASQTRVVKLE